MAARTVLAIFGAIQAGLILGSGVYRSYPSVTLASSVMFFSVAVFFAYRWVMLRAAVRSNRFSIEQFRQDPGAYWRGPPGPFRIWLGFTMVVWIVIIVYAARTGRS